MKKMITLKVQSVCLLIFFSVALSAQQWGYAGSPKISQGQTAAAIVTDRTGSPYIAYPDGINSTANVKRFDGTSWVSVGDTSFSANAVSSISLAFDNSNTPYVAFSDGANDFKATVMAFDGVHWNIVGQAGFSDSVAGSTSIAIDNNGTIYVAYKHNYGAGTVVVKKYTGSAWVSVGALPYSYNVSNIAIDPSGRPYVAFTDVNNGFGFMRKFDGTSWVNLGAFVVDYVMNSQSIAIDQQGTAYIAFQDDNNGATVFKYVNSAWDTLGYAGFNYCSFPGANYISLTISSNDSIYLAFQDGAPADGGSGKAVAAKFTGSGWSAIGTTDFTFGEADGTQIAVDGSGTPYVAFADKFYNGQLSVMKYGVATTGISEVPLTERLEIMPNPAQDYIQLTIPKSQDGKLTLMDMNGQVIADIKTNGTGTEGINIESLAIGVYVLLYQDSATCISKRLVKE